MRVASKFAFCVLVLLAVGVALPLDARVRNCCEAGVWPEVCSDLCSAFDLGEMTTASCFAGLAYVCHCQGGDPPTVETCTVNE